MTTTQADENSWTTFEKLLLMQSVYKHGDNWLAISRTMKQNPMVSHSADFFTQKNCSTEYNTLVDPLKNEAEIEDEHKKRSGEYVNDKQRMPWTAKLARQLYHERIVELKSFISSTEQTFRTLVNEIDEIKSGKWDSKFTEMIKEEQKKKELEKKSEVVSETSTVEIPKDSSDIISDVNVKIEPPLVQSSAKVESVIPMDVDKNDTIIGNEIAFNEEPQIEIKPLKEVDPTSVTEDMEIDVVSSTLPSAEVKDVVQPQTPSTPLAEPSENLVIDSSKEPNFQTEITVAAGLLKDDIELPVEGDVNMMDIDEEKTTEKPKSTSSSTLALESTSSTSETDASKAEQAKKTPSTESIIAEDTPQTMIGDVAMDVDELNGVEILQVDSESPERVHFTENLVTSPTSIEEVDTTVNQENIISKEQYEPKGQLSKITTEEEIDEVVIKGNEPESSEVVSIQPTENEETMIDIIKLESSSLSSSDEAKTDIKEDVSEKVKDDTEEDSIMVDKSTLPEESEEDKYSSKEKTTTPQAEFKEPSTSGSGLVPIVAVPNTPSNVRPETPGDHTAPTPTHQYDTAPTPSGETSDDKKLKTWQKLVSMILHEISNHRFASVFQNPIREQDAPGYYDIVKQPMDLKTLKKRLREGTFHDTNSFHRDLMLMFMNASVFNREETDIHQMALEMKDHVETQIMEFRKSEGSGGTHEPATRRKSMAIDAHEAAYFASDRRSEGDRSVVAGSSLRGKPKDDMADTRPTKKTKRLSVSLKKSERDN